MELDRKLIKSQSKQIIKGKMFKLFFVCLVVTMVLNGFGINQILNIPNLSEVKDEINFDYFDDFTASVNLVSTSNEVDNLFASALISAITNFVNTVCFFMTPLSITLYGLFLMLVRNELGDNKYLSYVFKNTFNKTYWKKLACYIISMIRVGLLTLLGIVPGVICALKYYFAYTIMATNPQLGPKESINLSKRITNNHKGELFKLELSFIGWYLLCVVTLGIMAIYVIPYKNTTVALYYENFRLRALEEGAISENDFLSFQERSAIQYKEYMESVQQNPMQYAPYQNQYVTNQMPMPQSVTQPVQQVYVTTVPTQPQQIVVSVSIPNQENEIQVKNDSEYGSGMTNDYYNSYF